MRRPLPLRKPGFTLIEALVFLFIFSLVTLVFFQTYAQGTALIQQSKNRLGAIALANQKMEIVRSLDYANIGTTTGIPAGSLPQDEAVQENNSSYNVHTFVEYVDDAFDGRFGGTPNDTVPNDYKRVKIEVSWGTASDAEKVALISNFAPDGVEQSTGGGILSINILDSQGTGVPGASVTILNTSVSPNVNISTTTDATGNIFLIGSPASTQKYQVTFSKSGYYGSHTYAPYPTTSFNPIDIHASVVNTVVNEASYIMDHTSSLTLDTVDPFDTSIPNVSYRIDGGRQLGTVAGSNPAQPVYDFGENGSTNASGTKTYADRSFGTYVWALGSGVSGYTFIRLNPDVATGANNIDLSPNATQTVKMILADNAVPAILTTVTSATDGSPLSGASVHVTNASLGYDATVTTSLYGKAYFPTTLPALVAGTYDVSVSDTGFTTANSTVDVGSGLVEKSITLSL